MVNNSSGYDVGANCEATAATGVFDVTLLSKKVVYFRTYNAGGVFGKNVTKTDVAWCDQNTWFWWNDSVNNYVRKLEHEAYVGREDWGIVEWNSVPVSVTVNEFSDSGSGFDTVSYTHLRAHET